jgi:hypothetical protein
VAPLIARTDNLCTFAPMGIAEDARAFGPAVLEPPIDIPPISFPVIWNRRLANDPAIRWIRELVIDAYGEADRRIAAILAESEIIRPGAGNSP